MELVRAIMASVMLIAGTITFGYLCLSVSDESFLEKRKKRRQEKKKAKVIDLNR